MYSRSLLRLKRVYTLKNMSVKSLVNESIGFFISRGVSVQQKMYRRRLEIKSRADILKIIITERLDMYFSRATHLARLKSTDYMRLIYRNFIKYFFRTRVPTT